MIVGTKNESKLVDKILNGVRIGQWHSLVGKTNVLELVFVIKNASIFVGNDTGGVHIAAAVQTPAVCITSGTGYARFSNYTVEDSTDIKLPHNVFVQPTGCPCNDHFAPDRCLYYLTEDVLPCISAVTSEMVCQNIDVVLQNSVDLMLHDKEHHE